jgi:beta-lactamase regulating signal transducer with metallopeptidase domain
MLGGLPDIALLAPADSARAAATVYTVSLLATIPIGCAFGAGFLLRRASAGTRALVWRSALFALLLVYVGRQLPVRWSAIAVPSLLAQPLIALGRIQVMGAHVAPNAGSTAAVGPLESGHVVQLFMFAYWLIALAVLLPTVVSLMARGRELRAARPLREDIWSASLAAARNALGMRRQARLYMSANGRVPVTWGVLRPVIMLPASAGAWNGYERQMVLTHELAHVQSFDWPFALLGRLVSALFWFHPGSWWIAHRLHEDRELACDDRVIASGARRSDYAELLMRAAAAARRGPQGAAAMALSTTHGLRARLAAVLDTNRVACATPAAWMKTLAGAMAVALGTTAAAIQPAPSRDVLTSLVHDTRWESRAYAVQGLAERQDSVAVARSVAERDPNPRVRAWARYALGETLAFDALPPAGARFR